MNTPKLHLICDTNPMCYGSSAALLSIADALCQQSSITVEVVAMAKHVTAQILEPDPAIHQIIAADVKCADDVRAALDAHPVDAALVVSNQHNISLYEEMGIPIFFVDILFWYGGAKNGRVWEIAEGLFVQNFPGVKERAATKNPVPTVVGPLIRPWSTTKPREGTLVGLGGGRSRWVLPGVNSDYATFVCDAIASLEGLPAPITIAGGQEALASIAPHHPIHRLAQLRSLPQPEYLETLCTSALYLTAPGLNSIFEGMWSDTPMLALPPQNASQVAQLAVYTEYGVFDRGLNLWELDPMFPATALKLTEAEQTQHVLQSLARLCASDASARVAEHLTAQLATVEARRPAVRALRDSLGEPGGAVVAAQICDWWRRLWM